MCVRQEQPPQQLKLWGTLQAKLIFVFPLTLKANTCFICFSSLPTLEQLIATKKQLSGLYPTLHLKLTLLFV